METIKANSLMLNDWVKIKEPNKYAGAIGTIQTLSSLEGAYLAIYINDPNFGTFVTEVFCEDIEPITLTAAILERNGWTKPASGRVWDSSNVMSFVLEEIDDGSFEVATDTFSEWGGIVQDSLRPRTSTRHSVGKH